MAEINLLHKYPKSPRPIEERGRRKLSGKGWIEESLLEEEASEDIVLRQLLINAARKFGREYFDGDRLYGYGGYFYHEKFWTDTVLELQKHYKLTKDSSVLDVGCAKGFLLFDFQRLIPGISVAGIDISQYAYENALARTQPYMKVGSASKLPYADRSFDLVISINTVDQLPLQECKQALREIQRVSRGKSFITVNAWRNSQEQENLQKWSITAQTSMHVDDWRKLFQEVGYTGDFYWFIAE